MKERSSLGLLLIMLIIMLIDHCYLVDQINDVRRQAKEALDKANSTQYDYWKEHHSIYR